MAWLAKNVPVPIFSQHVTVAGPWKPYKTLYMMRFDGQKWALFGDAITE